MYQIYIKNYNNVSNIYHKLNAASLFLYTETVLQVVKFYTVVKNMKIKFF